MSTSSGFFSLPRVRDRKLAWFARVLILSLLGVLAFSTRLFSVLRYESVIHEFDPYFNYRSTIHLVNEGE